MSKTGAMRALGVLVFLLVPAEQPGSLMCPTTLAAPFVGPESDPSRVVPRVSVRIGTPAFAFDGSGYFMVYRDPAAPDNAKLFGARFDALGNMLDPYGTPLGLDGDFPHLSWNGSAHLLIWRGTCEGETGLCAARIAPDGAVLDPGGRLVSAGAGPGGVDTDGTDWLVVFHRAVSEHDTDVYAARVTATGVILDRGGFVVAGEPNRQWFPRVAFDGTNYLVIWQDQRDSPAHPLPPTRLDIYGARLSRSGAVLEPRGIPIAIDSPFKHNATLAWTGSYWLVAWPEWDAYGHLPARAVASRVASDGTVLDARPILVSDELTWAPSASVIAATDGTNGIVQFTRTTSSPWVTLVRRISPSGLLLENPPIRLFEGAWTTRWIHDGTDAIVYWHLGGLSSLRLNAARGLVGPEIFFGPLEADTQGAPAVATTGRETLVVWQDGLDIRGGLLPGPPGGPGTTPSPPFTIHENRRTSTYTRAAWPRVAASADRFLVIWAVQPDEYEDWSLYGMRLEASGAFLDDEPFLIARTTRTGPEPAITCDGEDFLVVWHTRESRLRGTIVTSAGRVLDPSGRSMSGGDGHAFSPAVASNGKGFLVAYAGSGSGCDICAVRLDRQGALLTSGSIGVDNKTAAADRTRVASDGKGYLVVWWENRFPLGEVHAARVSGGGKVLDRPDLTIATDASYQRAPAVTFDGTSYVIAWETYPAAGESDIRAVRVSPQGGVMPADAGSFPVSTHPGHDRSLAIGSAGDGSVVVGYQRFEFPPPYRTDRIFLRQIAACDPAEAPCPVEPVSPNDGAVIPSPARQAAFWWEPGSHSKFRLEFASSPDFTGDVVFVKKKLRPTISIVAKGKKWKKIRALAGNGEPIYWRVAWDGPEGAGMTTPRSFRIGP